MQCRFAYDSYFCDWNVTLFILWPTYRIIVVIFILCRNVWYSRVTAELTLNTVFVLFFLHKLSFFVNQDDVLYTITLVPYIASSAVPSNAISHRPTRGSISPYNIAGLTGISEVSEEVATQIAKIAVVDNPALVWGPAKRNPRECAHAPYIFRN